MKKLEVGNVKQHNLVLLSFFILASLGGCGGKTLETDSATPDGGAGTGGTGTAGAGGSGGTGGTGNGGSVVGGNGGSTGGTAGSSAHAGSAGTGGDPCSLTTGNDACDACMTTSCLTECYGCESNTQCTDFVGCALSCATGDASCMQSCVTEHEDGVEDGLPLVGPAGCLRNECNAPCIGSVAQCTLSAGDAECDQCVVGYCMNSCTTCADNPSCVSLVECALACPPDDQGCLFQCGLQNTGGITDANAFIGDGGCVSKYCSVECKGAPDQCAIEFGDPSCDACVSSQCLTPCNTCAANASCVALVECALACPPDDQGCLTTCALQNPTGVLDANNFAGDNGCVEQKCPVECGQGSGSCSLTSGNPACDACITTECLGSCSKCSENPDCMALVACYFACPQGDYQCQLGCGSSHSGGIQDAGPLIGPGGCVSSDCAFWCPF